MENQLSGQTSNESSSEVFTQEVQPEHEIPVIGHVINPEEKGTTPTLKEYYYMLREQIQHEDSLVNQRITWLVAIEGFLFAAFVGIIASRDKIDEYEFYILLLVIAIIGIRFSQISKQSIGAAHKSLEILRDLWNKPPRDEILKKEWESNANPRKRYPPITYVGEKSVTAWSAAFGIPNLIIYAWFLFVFIVCYKPLSNINSQSVAPVQLVSPLPTLIPTSGITPTQTITQTITP